MMLAQLVAALLQALDDPDANVRFHAIESLGRQSAPSAIHRLLEIAERAISSSPSPPSTRWCGSTIRWWPRAAAAGSVAWRARRRRARASGRRGCGRCTGAGPRPAGGTGHPIVAAVANIHSRYQMLFGGADPN